MALAWRSTYWPISRAPTSTTPRRAAPAAGLPQPSAARGVSVECGWDGVWCLVYGVCAEVWGWLWGCGARAFGPGRGSALRAYQVKAACHSTSPSRVYRRGGKGGGGGGDVAMHRCYLPPSVRRDIRRSAAHRRGYQSPGPVLMGAVGSRIRRLRRLRR
jgi:hypothetical protein